MSGRKIHAGGTLVPVLSPAERRLAGYGPTFATIVPPALILRPPFGLLTRILGAK